MIGIYKITNQINNHCYIGQSRNIQRRWNSHREAALKERDDHYNYPLYRAFRKYGLDAFTFEVIEECSLEELSDRELYWIRYYNPEYNQTSDVNVNVKPMKLTKAQVEEIQFILMNDKTGEVSHVKLAEKYGVSTDTIRDINVGRTWLTEGLTYPLHVSRFDNLRSKEAYSQQKYCIDCGAPIAKGSTRCRACASKAREKVLPVNREELKQLIRTVPFTQIAKEFGVTDNAIRKWCDKYSLPRRAKEIKAYSDAEWAQI